MRYTQLNINYSSLRHAIQEKSEVIENTSAAHFDNLHSNGMKEVVESRSQLDEVI